MPRSREEVISEMVDSGLFTDDEIRDAVKGKTQQPRESSALESTVSALSPITRTLQKFGELTQPTRESVQYATSPQGLLESGYSQLSNLAGKAGEFVTEEAGRAGVNPYIAGLAGTVTTFGPDIIAGIRQPGLPGAGEAVTEALESGAKTVARSTLPRTFKSTAGIPEQATEALINDPTIPLRRAGTLETVAAEMRRVQGLVQQAKQSIGSKFGSIYKRYVGIEGPMQEIEQTPIAQRVKTIETRTPKIDKQIVQERNPFTGAIESREIEVPSEVVNKKLVGKDLVAVPRKTHSYDDVIINKNFADDAFKKGDQKSLEYLYREYVGSPKTNLKEISIGNKDKLAILTRLKREIQQQAKYNKDPITLRPIDTAKDAAFKKMASDIDAIRTDLPNGDKLAMVDQAYEEINDIYGTIQRDLADPGKAQDTFMRIIKGDQTWLTSGKFQNKVNAIKKVERITGQKILEPALEELTSMIFKQGRGKGIAYNAIPATALGYSISELLRGNIPAAAAAAGSAGIGFAAGSPRTIGAGIRAGSRVGNYLNQAIGRTVSQFPKAAIGLGFGRRRSQ